MTTLTIPPIALESGPSFGAGAIRIATINGQTYRMLPRPGGRAWRVYDDSQTYRGEVKVLKLRRSGRYRPTAWLSESYEWPNGLISRAGHFVNPMRNGRAAEFDGRDDAIWAGIVAMLAYDGEHYPTIAQEAAAHA